MLLGIGKDEHNMAKALHEWLYGLLGELSRNLLSSFTGVSPERANFRVFEGTCGAVLHSMALTGYAQHAVKHQSPRVRLFREGAGRGMPWSCMQYDRIYIGSIR